MTLHVINMLNDLNMSWSVSQTFVGFLWRTALEDPEGGVCLGNFQPNFRVNKQVGPKRSVLFKTVLSRVFVLVF